MKSLNTYLADNAGGTLMTVFPHPDDETFGTGSLLLKAQEYGWHTVVHCLTLGESGQNFLPGKPADLGSYRAQEVSSAAEMLGVDELRLWNFPDGRLRETVGEWKNQIRKAIDEVVPDMLVSYGPSGITGHPDHIVTSVEVLDMLRKVETKNRPDLFWPIPNRRFRKRFQDTGTADLMQEANYRLDTDFSTKLQQVKAYWAHKSQFGIKRKALISLGHLTAREELYYNVDFRRNYPYRFVPYKI